jgi:hypothetical protein
MIRMPRRSVTRFFIPLIDVLILLFCIFLLMEFDSASRYDKEAETVADQAESIDLLAAELTARNQELRQFEEDRPQLQKLAELRTELERLRKINQQNFQQQAYIRIIDVDGKDGAISFYDDKRPKEPIIKIEDAATAKALLKRHEEEAKGRQVYYFFLYPRGGPRFVTSAGQEQQYRDWFKGAANSLVKVGS